MTTAAAKKKRTKKEPYSPFKPIGEYEHQIDTNAFKEDPTAAFDLAKRVGSVAIVQDGRVKITITVPGAVVLPAALEEE